MTIWLVAIVLLGCLTAVGYSQGAVRAGISFFGIIFATMTAGLAGMLVKPILVVFGMKSPLLLWTLPPFVGFIIVLAIIKVIGEIVHRKVDWYYRFKAGDLRLALWERLNARLGACIGALNGLAYMVLISFVIYNFSYWTVQMASSDNDPRTLRILNRMGRDLQSTGMSRAAAAIGSIEPAFYQTADLAGLLYQNSLLEARLMRYPGFLSLGERTEFQQLGSDTAFAEMRLSRAPIRDVMNNPSAKAILDNPELLRTIWDTMKPDLKDLAQFLEIGKSDKYDSEKILGRWKFDVSGSVAAYRRAKPNTPATEVQKLRAWMNERFLNVSLVAAPDHMAALKNLPQNQPGSAAPTTKNLQGKWKPSSGGDYELELEGGTDRRTAKFEGSRLVVSSEIPPLVFTKGE